MPVGCRELHVLRPARGNQQHLSSCYPEGQLLQVITEMKAQMEERQIQAALERENVRRDHEQADLDRENVRRDREQAALDRENAFRAREALERSNEQLRAQIVALRDSQKRQRSVSPQQVRILTTKSVGVAPWKKDEKIPNLRSVEELVLQQIEEAKLNSFGEPRSLQQGHPTPPLERF